LFLRHLRKAAAESMDDLVARILRYTPHKKTGEGLSSGERQPDPDRWVHDPATSTTTVGSQYDCLAVEEVTQLSQVKIDSIEGSIRTSRRWLQSQEVLTFNPGRGYSYIKRKVVLRGATRPRPIPVSSSPLF